jgi:SAM-dependent methyltransferase
MDSAEIRARVQSFPRWHYEFDLNGVRTPIFDPRHRNRHAQRKGYFFDPLVELCGGSLSGLRVLDLGCNAGYWSLLAIEAGADFVLGIDGRQDHIAQAELVFEAKTIDRKRYRFVSTNIFDHDFEDNRFDVVLCLGLMYHVAKPFELMDLISRINNDLLVIDTAISRIPGRSFEFEDESLDEARDAVDYSLALWPTRAAVFDLLRQFDYEAVVLHPQFSSWEGCREYRLGFRRAFVCAKQTPLHGLSHEEPGRLSALRDLAAWGAFHLGRRMERRLAAGRKIK